LIANENVLSATGEAAQTIAQMMTTNLMPSYKHRLSAENRYEYPIENETGMKPGSQRDGSIPIG
jgi:hypothetical protein